MAPAIIAAIISAAASKVKQNQASAQAMNQGNKTAGTYQIGGSDNNSRGSYQSSSSDVNVNAGGGDLAKSIVKQYLEKKMGNEGEGADTSGAESAAETASETMTEEAAENIH